VNRTIESYDKIVNDARELMVRKNHDYGDIWRRMRLTSITDQILVKIERVRTLEELHSQGKKELVSEGIESEYCDILNYAIFGLIMLSEQEQSQKCKCTLCGCMQDIESMHFSIIGSTKTIPEDCDKLGYYSLCQKCWTKVHEMFSNKRFKVFPSSTGFLIIDSEVGEFVNVTPFSMFALAISFACDMNEQDGSCFCGAKFEKEDFCPACTKKMHVNSIAKRKEDGQK